MNLSIVFGMTHLLNSIYHNIMAVRNNTATAGLLVTSGKANLHRGDKATNCKEAIRETINEISPEKRPEQMGMAGRLTRWQ